MATFELTARHDMCIGSGKVVPKGSCVTLNIYQMGITPVNLFNNSRCENDVLRQFTLQGIDIPRNSAFLNRGHWDIRIK